ncbi:MAG: transposase [Micropepsaceae bacterium]
MLFSLPQMCAEVVRVVGRPKVSTDRLALLAFWRRHVNAWLNSDLGMREYCAVYELRRETFVRWRKAIKQDDAMRERAAVRRGRLKKKREAEGAPLVPERHEPSNVTPPKTGRRRFFADDIKRQMIEETCQPGMSVSEVARRYNVNPNLIFNWRRELGLRGNKQTKFIPVRVTENGEEPQALSFETPDTQPQTPQSASEPGVEIQLLSGRRVRFDAKLKPATMRLLIAALEGNAP